MDALITVVGLLVGGLVGLAAAFGILTAALWAAAWWERDCATVSREHAHPGSSICRSCGRVVGWKHKRSCEFAG